MAVDRWNEVAEQAGITSTHIIQWVLLLVVVVASGFNIYYTALTIRNIIRIKRALKRIDDISSGRSS